MHILCKNYLHTHSGILITYGSKGHILVLANWYLCIAIGSISGNMCQLLSFLEVCMTAEKQRGECTITQKGGVHHGM